MNTAELTALHTETIADMKRARTIANIERRALTLWADGYGVRTSAEVWGAGHTLAQPGAYFVTAPAKRGDVNGDTKQTYKVRCSPEAGYSCTYPAFAEYDTCKHLIAVRNLIEEGEQADRDYLAYEEQMNFFNGRYDR